MTVQLDRIQNDMEAVAAMNATAPKGITRFSYSEQDMQARAYLLSCAKKLGFPAVTDLAGNIHIRFPAQEAGKGRILFGSHLDTVLRGGKYDGLTGVCAGMEVLRVLAENNYRPNHNLELLVFAEEEGSNFGLTLFGSKLMVGGLTEADLKQIKNDEGADALTVLDAFLRGQENVSKERQDFSDAVAFLELHIEQSHRLEKAQKTIGIVDTIVGIANYRVTLRGVSNHGGSTQMDERLDALAAAAEMITAITAFAHDNPNPACVATIGKLNVESNIPNIVSDKASFVLDFRSDKDDDFLMIRKEIESWANRLQAKLGVGICVEQLGFTPVTHMSETIGDIVESRAVQQNLSYMHTYSGAVHDSAIMAKHIPTALIFIPSKDGKSHCPEEYTSWEDVAAGSEVLLQTILELDRHLGGEAV